MAVLRKSQQLARAHFLVRNGLHCDEALTEEILDVGPHAILGEVIEVEGTGNPAKVYEGGPDSKPTPSLFRRQVSAVSGFALLRGSTCGHLELRGLRL